VVVLGGWALQRVYKYTSDAVFPPTLELENGVRFNTIYGQLSREEVGALPKDLLAFAKAYAASPQGPHLEGRLLESITTFNEIFKWHKPESKAHKGVYVLGLSYDIAGPGKLLGLQRGSGSSAAIFWRLDFSGP